MTKTLRNNTRNTIGNSSIGLIQKTSKTFQKIFFALLLLIGVSGGVWGQTAIWSQNFDGAWTTDAPSGMTGTNTADVAWHRNDFITNWGYSTSGSPISSGAQSTTNYARYHSYGISTLNNNPNSQMTRIQDMSTYASGYTVQLSFYYINPSGTDKLRIRFSLDGGANYVTIQDFTTASSWTLATINVPVAYLFSGFRMRFMGITDYGSDDIGLDQIILEA